jgi:predicted nucleotidyltransferase
VDVFIERLSSLPGVVAVALGGSRASGAERPGSDWDFAVYYRGSFSADAIRAWGLPGEVFEAGAWGRILNGGAWLRVDGEDVDVLYRDLDLVETWLAGVDEGRFEIDEAQGFVGGLATYVPVGELAVGKALSGSLPHVSFPAALKASARNEWSSRARFSLWDAGNFARRGDVTICAGLLAKAAVQAGQARMAERGEWVLNEKEILIRAGLADASAVLGAVGSTGEELSGSVARMEVALGIEGSWDPRAA